MKLLIKAIFFVIALAPATVLAEATIFQPLLRVQYNGTDDVVYFVGNGRWAGTACPNATYVQVAPSVPGKKQILALGLAAKMGGKNVQFYGVCHTDPDYFNAFYIVVE